MGEVRKGRQTPTQSVVLPYSSTYGAEAIDIYNSTGRTAQEWQELLLSDILAVNEEGLWVHTKFGYSVPRRNGKNEIVAIREMYGLKKGERILHTAHRTTTTHSAWERLSNLLKKANIEVVSSYKAFGKEHLEVAGGGIIEFRTRTSKGGLGEGFDLLIIDEAQEYQDDQESALKYLWNVISALPGALVTFIQTATPQLATALMQFVPEIATQVQTALPQLYEMANGMLLQITTAIQTNLPGLLQQGVEIVTNIANGILQNIPQLISMAATLMANFENAIWSALPLVLAAGGKLILNLVNGIINNLPQIATAAAQAVAKMTVTIGQNLPQVLQSGIEIIGKLAAGLIRAYPSLIAQIPQIISGIRSAFSNVDWWTIGHNIIQGIANGLRNAGHMLWEAVKGVLGNFKDNVLAFFGIHSPARWGVFVGEMIDAGFVKGIIGKFPAINSAVTKLRDIATSPFSNANLNYDLQGTANSSRTSGNETSSRLDTLIALLRAIIAIIDGKPSGDVSERELIRALRDMGVVFE